MLRLVRVVPRGDVARTSSAHGGNGYSLIVAATHDGQAGDRGEAKDPRPRSRYYVWQVGNLTPQQCSSASRKSINAPPSSLILRHHWMHCNPQIAEHDSAPPDGLQCCLGALGNHFAGQRGSGGA